MSITTKEKEIAQKLLVWMKRWQVRNIFMWKTSHQMVFGLSGKPLQLQQRLMNDKPQSNEGNWLTKNAADAFEIELKWTEDRWKRGRQTPNPQFWHGEKVFSAEFLEGIESLLNYLMGTEEEAQVVLLPEPGYPWHPDYVIRYYDVKKNRVITSKKPAWAIMGTYEDERTGVRETPGYVADYCQIFPTVNLSEMFPQTLMNLPRGSEVMVTHTLDLPRVPEGEDRKLIMRTAHEIKKCGGLIFPSLAVGLIPASNYGPITLVMSAGCVLTGLHPYRPRGRYPVVLYNADVWTETVKQIKRELGRALFEELTGLGANYYYQHNLLALGPVVKEGMIVSEIEAKRIRNVRELETTIRKRFGLWKGSIRPEEWLSRTEMMTPTESYAYLEAKVSNVLGLENIKFAVCATEFKESTRVFLKSLGLRISVYPVDAGINNRAYVPESHKDLEEELKQYPEYETLIKSWRLLDYLRYHFAWEASKVIRQVSMDSGSVLDLEN